MRLAFIQWSKKFCDGFRPWKEDVRRPSGPWETPGSFMTPDPIVKALRGCGSEQLPQQPQAVAPSRKGFWLRMPTTFSNSCFES
jgi:hypothetical protein